MTRKIFLEAILLLMLGTASYRLRGQAAANDSTEKFTVYIFLSETCPICQSYTVKLKELYALYHTQNVQFLGVFPNYYSTAEDISAFGKKYGIPFKLVQDTGALAGKLKATVTPEAFVTSAAGAILYSGRIDDSFYKIGRRRNVISSHDLKDAISNILSGNPVSIPKTQAVGCMISLSK